MRWVAAGLPLLLLAGCEPRTRSNPFDPGNPDTHGEPRILDALAGDRQVRLEWDLSSFQGVGSIEILRREDDVESAIFSAAHATSGEIVDRALSNGVTFTYRLKVVSEGTGEPVYSADVQATPGASQPWVADASGGGVARLSPDGRAVLFRTEPFREVLDLEIERDGAIWIADYGNGAVVNYDASGHRMRQWQLFGANALALSAGGDTIWAGSFNRGEVDVYTRGGAWLWADTTAGMVEEVEAAPDGGVWVGSRDRGLSRVDFGRVRYHVPSVRWPVDLEVEAGGTLWIVDRASAGVGRLAPGEVEPQSSPVAFTDPTDAALDGAGGAWVVDRGGGTVLHLNSSLRETARYDVGPAQNVAWDGVNQRLWLSMPGEERITVIRLGLSPGEFTEVASLHLGGSPAQIEGLWR
jgi:hypothetical protein